MNMTMTSPSPVRSARRGFTLIEILVVVGIIVVLASILVPLAGRAMRQAKQTRTAADMASIGTALEAFKADHGDYPRTQPGERGSGAAVLGRFLFGPYGDGELPRTSPTATPVLDPNDPPVHTAGQQYLPGDTVRESSQLNAPTWVCVRTTTTAPPNTATLQPATLYDWAPIGANDFVDGPGLQLRAGTKKYGPYIQEGKFRLRGLAVLDGNDNPILYFPGRPGQGGDLTGAGAKPDNAYVSRSGGGNKSLMKYDADDNLDAFRREGEADNLPALRRIRGMLGDYGNTADANAVIETDLGEKIATEAPFLLWAAGADGLFGPTDFTDGNTADKRKQNQINVDKCDDVTNFKQ